MTSPETNQQAITLAIFPFENLNDGKEADIFCRSFSTELITELSRFRRFQIIAIDSISDKGRAEPGTDYFVKGSFRTHRDQIRVNVQLTDSRSRHLIWADRFSGPSEDLLALQENLLTELVSSLQVQLNYDLLSSIRKKTVHSLKAYECWLYGMDELRNGSPGSDIKAREYFQKAIDIDPGYSLALSGMSLTYFNEWSCQLWDRWELSKNGAFEWAQKAMEIDEQNYVAAYVLGRIFLYQNAWETSEHFLRKSLRLNPNDPESLINIALCFIYLGYSTEAFTLYEKAVRLNPAGAESYHPVGAIILFELGRFEDAIRLAYKTGQAPYVDFKAYCAAAWHQLGNEVNMKECLDEFLESYIRLINHGRNADIAEAVEWMSMVNPFRNPTYIGRFWGYITDGKFRITDDKLQITEGEYRHNSPADNHTIQPADSRIHEAGDFWEFVYSGKTVQLATVKGFSDLKKLIREAGTPFHCTELMDVAVLSSGEMVIDEQAKQEYRRKITSLQHDIEEAENDQDFSKAESLQLEYEQLISHLSGAMGIRGEARRKGSTIEKARSAVTWRIRNSISRIEQVHPALGKHLSNSIKTGTFCSYDPENLMNWCIS